MELFDFASPASCFWRPFRRLARQRHRHSIDASCGRHWFAVVLHRSELLPPDAPQSAARSVPLGDFYLARNEVASARASSGREPANHLRLEVGADKW